ncbi:MAG: ATP-binding protein [Treponema sp.]
MESSNKINMSVNDRNTLLKAVKGMPPDIEAALIINDIVEISTITELKEGQILKEKDLWSFLQNTSIKYAYQFEIPPVKTSGNHIVLLSRIAKQKDGSYKDNVPLLILTFSVFFITICIATIYTIAYSIFSSLMLLKTQTQKIADGDLNEEIKIPSDKMKRNEITQFLTSLERMRQSLVEAKNRQSRFIMGISHDLRTPVAVIKGYTEAMLDGMMKSKEEINSALKIVSVKTSQLESMLDTLINYEKLQTKDLINTLKMQKLAPILIEFAKNAEITGTVFHKNVSYAIDIDREFSVPVNEQLLLRAFENLLSNALRYTKDNSCILLYAQEKSDCIELVIEDCGIGIEEKDIEHIFDLFYRGTNSRREEGMGIGLSVVKNIMDLHGWDITVESKKNIGTKFTITVPKSSTNLPEINSVE